MMNRKARRQHARTHINPKLRRNLRLFSLISIILLAVVMYEAGGYHASFYELGLGLLAGIILGSLFARMYKQSWDKNAQHVTSNIDIFGMVVLILYIAFDLKRSSVVRFLLTSKPCWRLVWPCWPAQCMAE